MEKILYVDETEDANCFYVVGLLVDSRHEILRAYNSFKKSIKAFPIHPKERTLLYNEFKSTIVDRSYHKVKIKMLSVLNNLNYQVICSSFTKNTHLLQSAKEQAYISLLLSIIRAINEEVTIVYDEFHKEDFEASIENTLMRESHVKHIIKADAFDEKGLQFIDNICSTIRRYSDNPEDPFFALIKQNVTFIK